MISRKQLILRTSAPRLSSIRKPAVVQASPWLAVILSVLVAVMVSPDLAAQESPPSPDELYPTALISMSNDSHFSHFAFLVDKTERRLTVYEIKGNLVHRIEDYPADIGKNSGDKEKANDARTPVGIYFLMSRKTQPEIPFETYGSLAFTTDYPNIFDKRVAKGGGGIWLHAVPDKVALTRGSRGCVVVRNDVIQHLEKYIELGQTPLLITEKIEYVDKEHYLLTQKQFQDSFEKWRLAWQDSDVENYIQFYDPTFRNADMDYQHWYRHKKKLKELYSKIEVQLGSPLILRNRDQVVIRTLQSYNSNLHQDFGEKTIHAHAVENSGFQIIREDWRGLPNVRTAAEAAPPK